MNGLGVDDAVALLPGARVSGPGRGPIASLTYDSRSVVPGSLFAAIPGSQADGHRFIGDALAAGATAVIARDAPDRPWTADATLLLVDDPRRALARLASAFFGEPSAAMRVAGVTGTNGKTTVTYLVESMLGRDGAAVGVVGTTGIRVSGRSRPSTHTTPEGPELQRALAEMRDAGADAAVLELSSHALEQGRAVGTRLDVAAFTNLTRDHLDYHGDLERYYAAKRRIVDELLTHHGKPGATLVSHVDDPRGEDLATRWPRVLRTSTRRDGAADVRPAEVRFDLDGIHGTLTTPLGPIALESGLVGGFNLANVVVATAIAIALDTPPAAIAGGLRALRRVPGRLEPVHGEPGAQVPRVLVDYAHTPDALRAVLAALRPLVRGELWTVFGCGGDRDQGKRPLMAAAAAAGSDRLVVTSDNPRGEDPQAIVDAIVAGLSDRATPWTTDVDRRGAIGAAIAAAGADDLVLIAGKGHERVQVIGDRELPFDDREVAAAALRERGER